MPKVKPRLWNCVARISPVGDSFAGLARFDVTFLVRILIVGTYTFDLEEDKSKLGLHGLPIISLYSNLDGGNPNQRDFVGQSHTLKVARCNAQS